MNRFAIEEMSYPSPPMFSVVAHEATVTMHTHIRSREGEIYAGLNHNPEPEAPVEATDEHPGGEFIGGEANVIGHHIFEFLTRLPFVQGRRVVLWNDLPARYLELVRLAGFEYDLAPRGARFERIRAYSTPVGRFADRRPYCYAPAIFALRDMLKQRMRMFGRRIYCVRNAKHRVVLNNDQVMKTLIERGIEPIVLEDLSMAEQLRTMQEAALLVLPIGSGAVFSMFTDGAVVEMAPLGVSGDFSTKMWAKVCQRPWVRVVGATENPARDANYSIDIDRLNAAIDAVEMSKAA